MVVVVVHPHGQRLTPGELAKARVQVQEAQSAVHLLPAEGYGAMVRGGVERLAIRVEAAS